MAKAKTGKPRVTKVAPQILIAVPKSTGFAASAPGVREAAAQHLDTLGRSLAEAGGRFMESFSKSRLMNPNEIELSMELSLEAGGNWIIASGKTAATISVSMKWTPDRGA